MLKSQVKDDKRCKSRIKVKFSLVKTLTAVGDLSVACADVTPPCFNVPNNIIPHLPPPRAKWGEWWGFDFFEKSNSPPMGGTTSGQISL